jgi:hypothetical protein
MVPSKKTFAKPPYHCDGKTPIRKVRVVLNCNPDFLFGLQRERRHYRFYEYANNYHMEITQDNATGKWHGIIVTMMEASQRIRRSEDAVKREYGEGRKFIMDC